MNCNLFKEKCLISRDDYDALIDGRMKSVRMGHGGGERPEAGKLLRVFRMFNVGEWCLCLITHVKELPSSSFQISVDVVSSGNIRDIVPMHGSSSCGDEKPTPESDFKNYKIDHFLSSGDYDLVNSGRVKYIVRGNNDALEGDIVRISSRGSSAVNHLFAEITHSQPATGMNSMFYIMSIEVIR